MLLSFQEIRAVVEARYGCCRGSAGKGCCRGRAVWLFVGRAVWLFVGGGRVWLL
ncbi:hypothetical protein [Bartonella sp. TT67HLJMS]|uniref:hypothetical protein n=1 Tax=Bartonella sp. TT67HLJMS TaxID=3243582 RepID=UPI0035CFD3F8